MPSSALTPPSAPLLRVVLTGAESTGKTTLARRLAAHYGTIWVPEFVRGFVERKGAPPEAADVEAIARGVAAAEAAARPSARRVLFLDTDLLSTLVYARHFYGAAPDWVETALRDRPADLYLLLAPDVPWTPDPGQRASSAVRALLQTHFERALSARGLPVARVSGDRDARFAAAVAAVDGLIERRAAG